MCSYWNKYYLVTDIKMDPNKLREININSCV